MSRFYRCGRDLAASVNYAGYLIGALLLSARPADTRLTLASVAHVSMSGATGVGEFALRDNLIRGLAGC
jgi:hypothetical protein